MKEFIFKYRGWLFIPSALLMFYLAKPNTLSLVIGFLLAFGVGEAIRIWAVGFSGVTTRKSELDAPQLVTAGPYALVRNPLYIGNLISWIGFCIASSGNADQLSRFLIFASLIISYGIIYGSIIPLEEEFLAKEFGESFQNYLSNVPRMIPNFKPYKQQAGKWEPEVILKAESQTIIMLLLVAGALVLKYLQIISF